jgi:hypothetical protein
MVETLHWHKGCKSGAQRRREKKARTGASVSGEGALPMSGEKGVGGEQPCAASVGTLGGEGHISTSLSSEY